MKMILRTTLVMMSASSRDFSGHLYYGSRSWSKGSKYSYYNDECTSSLSSFSDEYNCCFSWGITIYASKIKQ